eukprot:TRINITY_DN47765_c0_g1_i1.p1 TRINITY_DN47765_c0_g1~~TRINITY_DN47765_c0_g1_i1.p1  ORF type:complete len:151 (-),score=7.69 TRINITY_DN47765_c0_g1_i1:237-689(-)
MANVDKSRHTQGGGEIGQQWRDDGRHRQSDGRHRQALYEHVTSMMVSKGFFTEAKAAGLRISELEVGVDGRLCEDVDEGIFLGACSSEEEVIVMVTLTKGSSAYSRRHRPKAGTWCRRRCRSISVICNTSSRSTWHHWRYLLQLEDRRMA